MRILAGIGVAVLLFAGVNMHAQVVREKSEKKTTYQAKTQVSKTEYSRPTTRRTYADPNTRTIRSPERIKMERAPKGKARRKSHFTEGPL